MRKSINMMVFVTFAALAAAAGCEDEPEPATRGGAGSGGSAGASGGGAGRGGAGSGGRMMSTDTSPPASMQTGKGMTNAMGQTMAPITVTTPTVSGGSSAEVTLPMGTTLKGANGQPLSGEATVTLTSNNIQPEGIASFNMMNMTPDLPSGETTAAQASVTVSVGGMPVASGSTPITIAFTIPDGARDGDGNPYTDATVVDYFSFHDGTWNKVSSGPLSQGATEMKHTPNGAVSRTELRARIRAQILAKIARFSGSAHHGEGN